MLHNFRDIAHDLTAIQFHPNFGVFPLQQIAHVGVSPSRNLKLFSREIILKYSNLCEKCTWTSQTDRRTDCGI